jgi:hypothetical protein
MLSKTQKTYFLRAMFLLEVTKKSRVNIFSYVLGCGVFIFQVFRDSVHAELLKLGKTVKNCNFEICGLSL